jgi:hypothetical protein
MLDVIGGGASGMLTAATQLNDAISGGFSMNYEGVQALLTYTKNLQQAVARALASQATLSQTPQLGATPAANTFKPYLPTIATDSSQGLIPVLQKLAQQLEQSATNLQNSLNAYERADKGNRSSMVNVQNTLYV